MLVNNTLEGLSRALLNLHRADGVEPLVEDVVEVAAVLLAQTSNQGAHVELDVVVQFYIANELH